MECGKYKYNLNGKQVNGGGKRAGRRTYITVNVSGKHIRI